MKETAKTNRTLTNARLDALRKARCAFFLEHLPGAHEGTLYHLPEEELLYLAQTDRLADKQGLLVMPFAPHGGKHPILLFPADRLRAEPIDLPHPQCNETYVRPEVGAPSRTYATAFTQLMQKLKSGAFKKVVLSRCDRVAGKVDPASTFSRACALYPTAFSYMLGSEATGLWMGATPELLLEVQHGQARTMALAGTMAKGKGPEDWDDKNRHEHSYVAQYIKERLATLGLEPHEGEIETVQAGDLVHLKREFTFELPEQRDIVTVIEALHPTPAVCGLPKEEAQRLLVEIESHDRAYYSGCLGHLNMGGKTRLFVNLRCMQVDKDGVTLYAGGGLMPESVMEQEWLETANKMMTMRKIL